MKRKEGIDKKGEQLRNSLSEGKEEYENGEEKIDKVKGDLYLCDKM